MDICVIGAGYVGLATAVGFASIGNRVFLVGRSKDKTERINSGDPTIYEPGMGEGLRSTVAKKYIIATTELKQAISDSEASFICVGTPSGKDGSIDLSDMKRASQDIGLVLKGIKKYHVVVVKSTVVPETTEKVVIPALEKFSGKKAGKDFGICMTPEFLREGLAMEDFKNPDRIVIGEFDKRSGDVIERLYSGFKAKKLRTGLKTAEMIKYASNSLLATKISFSNEIGNICKILGIDTHEVMKGVGLDYRLGPHFLDSGCGFGGSCFPKDVSAIISKAEDIGYEPVLLKQVMDINSKQKTRLVEMLRKKTGSMKGKKIAVLGLAFKPDTDDIREAPAIDVIRELKKEDAEITGYDPKAIENMKSVFPDIRYAQSARQAISGADACLVLTEWDEFKRLTDADFDSMNTRVILTGRRVLDGIRGVEGICW